MGVQVPESKVRKKDSGSSTKHGSKGSPKKAADKAAEKSPKVTKRTKKQRVGPKRWVAPLMLTLWLLGVAWIVVYYIAAQHIGFMVKLGNWNLLVGMGLIAAGFVVSTQWE